MRIIKDLKRFEGKELPYGIYFARYEIEDKEVNCFVRYRLYISLPWPIRRKCYLMFTLDPYGLYVSRSSF